MGGYCEHIEQLTVDESSRHVWRAVEAGDVLGAHQHALVAARRNTGYRPFTQLRHLSMRMCACAPPSVWHALLALMRSAELLRRADYVVSDDPLLVCALANLPSLDSLSLRCLWPRAFATFLQQRPLATAQHRFLAACVQLTHSRSGVQSSVVALPETTVKAEGWPAYGGSLLQLSDGEQCRDPAPRLLLRPNAGLFPAFQRSLSADLQAVLARWAAGNFSADDGRVNAAESPMVRSLVLEPDEWQCLHADTFHALSVSPATGEGAKEKR